MLRPHCGVVWCGVVWRGVVWCGVVWCAVVWCGVLLVPASQSVGTMQCTSCCLFWVCRGHIPGLARQWERVKPGLAKTW